MILKTDYERSGAGDLVEYMKYDRKQDRERVPIKDPTGRSLDEKEIDRFVGRSERHGMERHFIIAPDPEANVSTKDVDRGTRKVMNDWQRERPSIDYVYAVHAGEEGKSHSHAVATGQEHHLEMDTQDITEMRDRARDAIRRPQRARLPSAVRKLLKSAQEEQEREPERAPDRRR